MRRFISICLITKNVRRLRDFYRTVLEAGCEGNDGFVAFSTSGAQLCIFSEQGMQEMAPGCMEGAGHGSYALEFEVDDADAEYERLKQLDVAIVKPPATYPWGQRSVWFRDPDGNIVDFYARVAAAT